jgi:hypothetical protein
MLHTTFQHLFQGAAIFDEKAIPPERMIQPVALEGVQVHPDGKLLDGDFLQHGGGYSQGEVRCSVSTGAVPQTMRFTLGVYRNA